MVVDRPPGPGEIAHGRLSWAGPGGAGAGAAARLCELAGNCMFFTAVGDDALGRRSIEELERLGVVVEAVVRPGPTRRAIVHIDRAGERAITVVGARHAPYGDDPLPWGSLADMDVVYFTAGDAAALERARTAATLVATSRVLTVLQEARVVLDALIGSDHDPAEVYRPGDLDSIPRIVVRTRGAEGGTVSVDSGPPRPFPARPPAAPIVDSYGAGDSFAAGFAFALGRGDALDDALDLASRCGAEALGRVGNKSR